jgi:hypothetical protein
MKMKTPKSYKLTPTSSGGAHVQIPAIVLQWAGIKPKCRVVFSVRGERITMEVEK